MVLLGLLLLRRWGLLLGGGLLGWGVIMVGHLGPRKRGEGGERKEEGKRKGKSKNGNQEGEMKKQSYKNLSDLIAIYFIYLLNISL